MVRMNSFLIIILILSFNINRVSHANPVVLQFRFVTDAAGKDSEKFILERDGRKYFLSKDILIDRNDIEYAKSEKDEYGSNNIFIQFNSKGTEKLSSITDDANRNRKVGIIIDNRLIVITVIKVHVTNGKAMINGNFTDQEVKDIVRRINKK